MGWIGQQWQVVQRRTTLRTIRRFLRLERPFEGRTDGTRLVATAVERAAEREETMTVLLVAGLLARRAAVDTKAPLCGRVALP
eukprot:3828402-Prymnesium_polylepis.2